IIESTKGGVEDKESNTLHEGALISVTRKIREGVAMNGADEPCARRGFLAGAIAVGGLLALPGCATIAEYSYVDAVRRMLALSTQNAFSRLTAPDGFWDSAVARI